MATKKSVTKKVVTKKVIAKPVVATNSKAETKTPSAVFNIQEITDLLNAVKKSNVSKLKLEKDGFKITIKQGGEVVQMVSSPVASVPVVHHAPAPVVAPTPVSSAPTSSVASTPVASDDNLITIKSPMIGTFYRSAGPNKPLFVNVGDEIKPGSVLCIVEAMKLFNEIESEHSGKIVKVLVDDASPVEYDQPLFLISQ